MIQLLVPPRGKDSMPASTPAANHPPARILSSAEAVPIARSIQPSRRSLAIWIWSTLLIADVLLVARGVSGQMDGRLPPSLAVGSMSLIALASLAAWLAFRSTSIQRGNSQPGCWGPLAVSLTASLLWCVTLAFHAAPLTIGLLAGIVLVQGLIVGTMVSGDQENVLHQPSIMGTTECGSTLRVENLDAERRATINPTFVEPTSSFAEHHPTTQPPVETFLSAEEPPDEEDDSSANEADMTQWMSRRETDDGEWIEGWVRVEFSAGQRETTVHVSFCPPLARHPELETEDLDGGDLEIRVGSAFPFGARLTVRRTGSTAEPHHARIGFAAVVAANQRAA